MFTACSAGKKPLGGGWFGPGSNEIIITRMEPDLGAFNVIAKNITGSNISIRVTATCAAAN
jgi:hypothetical protein